MPLSLRFLSSEEEKNFLFLSLSRLFSHFVGNPAVEG